MRRHANDCPVFWKDDKPCNCAMAELTAAEAQLARLEAALRKAILNLVAICNMRDNADVERIAARTEKDLYAALAPEPTAAIEERGAREGVCAECGKYPSDYPGKLCVGCAAYKEHMAI